jgi:hypothetical protein
MTGAGEPCDVCERIARTERGQNPFTVARTRTGYVNLADIQYHEGYTIFVAKRCVNELHELPSGPVWEDPGFKAAMSSGGSPTPEQLARLRGCLVSALDHTDLTIERRFT